MTHPLYCPRCDEMVGVVRPWRGWKPAFIAWCAGVGVWVLLSPIVASDYCIMLPSFMAYLAAGGPLRSFAREKPTCRRCSLELDERRRAGSAVRVE